MREAAIKAVVDAFVASCTDNGLSYSEAGEAATAIRLLVEDQRIALCYTTPFGIRDDSQVRWNEEKGARVW